VIRQYWWLYLDVCYEAIRPSDNNVKCVPLLVRGGCHMLYEAVTIDDGSPLDGMCIIGDIYVNIYITC